MRDQQEIDAELRRLAEEKARQLSAQSQENIAALSPDEIGRIIHELRVHKIELEVQNENLRQAQEDLEAERSLYFNLYNFSPVGYFNLTGEGQILDANFTAASMLAMAPETLTDKVMTRFIFNDDQDIFYLFCKRLFKTNEPQACELRMKKNGSSEFWGRLDGSVYESKAGSQLHIVLSDITGRKRAAEELRETNEYLQNLFNYANAPIIVWDPQFHITRFNHAFESLTGLIEADVLGCGLEILFPPEHAGHSMGLIRKTLSGKRWETVEIKILHRDKTVRTVLWNSATLFTPDGQTPIATIAQGQDITERKNAEETLRESENRYRSLLANLEVGVVVHSSDSSIIMNNSKASELLGLSDDQMKGRLAIDPDWRFVREDTSPLPLGEYPVNRVIASRHMFKNVILGVNRSGGGDIVWCTVNGFPVLDTRGEITEVVISFVDITERRTSEQLLRDMQRRESIGILSGGIAHDFNNLLGSMMGNLSLAQAQLPVHHQANTNIEKALSAMDRAAELIQQMLAYSGKGKYRFCRMDIGGMLQEHVSLFTVSLPKNVKMVTHLPPKPIYVVGDPGQIEQIIMNLIINGGEAIGDTQGIVTIALAEVVMHKEDLVRWEKRTNATLEEGAYALLEVRDNGSGMSRETMEKIFDPFFTTKFTGRGLGLAAVLGIIQGHKGGITVESAAGKGTTFRLILPSVSSPLPGEEATPIEQHTQEPVPATILIIDDETDVASMAQEMLETGKYRTMVELNPLLGIERYEQLRSGIDLVLLDLTMPELSGKEVADALRRINPDVKIIISSGYSEEVVTQKIGDVRVSGFIQKPYRLQSLLTIVKNVL